MKKRSYLMLITAVFAMAAMIGCTSDVKTLKIDPRKLDFETVFIGDAKPIEITLMNKYGKAIDIIDIQLTNQTDFIFTFGATPLPITLDKGATHMLTVQFNPTVNGPIEGMIFITHTASSKTRDIFMEGIGQAVPRIELSETSHDYKRALNSTSRDYSFTIKNSGSLQMSITNFLFSGTGASAYSVTAGGTTPLLIAPGADSSITVQFTPPVTGTYPAELEIYHDAVNDNSPSRITLDGEGVATAPKIDLNRTSPWDFGNVAITIPSVLDLEIGSIGSDPLTVTDITFLTGTDFSLDRVEDSNGALVSLPQTLPVGTTMKAYIRFEPTALINYSDTMTIMHDGLYNPAPLDIEVLGTGRNEMSQTFVYTGAPQQWNVPAGVSAIIAECYGAEGGQPSSHAVGGLGGMATAQVPVTPGGVVHVYVGEKPFSIAGGFNGGGIGCLACAGVGGGGASDIRVGGTSLSDRKVVGGGGGGGGYNFPNKPSAIGGDGGGLIGERGTDGYGPGGAPGGTQTAGGAAGGTGATAGAFGIGGDGYGRSCGGGGGGGGWYGGGGGYCDGGGGGSSYYDAPGNSNTSTQQGVRSGNGEVIIRY